MAHDILHLDQVLTFEAIVDLDRRLEEGRYLTGVERVREFLDRLIAGDWPYLWLYATYLKVRQAGGSSPSPC